MDMSYCLTRIKTDLGLYALALPFDDPDKAIADIIQGITLPVFSIYCPIRRKFKVDVRDLERVEKTSNYEVYLLPVWKNSEIIEVEDLDYDESLLSGFGYWGGTSPMITSSLISQSMLGNMSMQISREMIPKPTFHFEAPRKITIYNLYNSCSIVLTVLCKHHPSLGSIPDTASESFYQLALLDVKSALYNVMKHYNEINSVHGSINLKIDDWANAADERKELISRWDDSFHEDRQSMYFV